MKKTVVRIVALDLIFLLLLMASGALSGVLSEIVYIAAFLLPLALFPWLSRGEARSKLSFGVSRSDAVALLLLVAPIIAVTVGLSALTSLLASTVGIGGVEMLSGSVFELIILHALLPAILEEALFRYIPLTLISPHSRRSAIVISSLLFAVAHCNILQIPYAFVAGLAFAVVDLYCESILPSVVLHLLNNLASVFWLWEGSVEAFRLPFIVSTVALSVISIVLVTIFRARYAKKASFLFDKSDKINIPPQAFVFVLVCILLAVGALM